MSTEIETRESRPAVDVDALEVDEPDIGFQAAIGVFCGVVLAGVVTTMLALAEADTATLLGTFPSAGTAGIIVGLLLSRRARGVPERLGASRRRWIYGLLPAAAFGVVTLVALFVPALGGAVAAAAFFSAVAVALSGLLVVGMGRNRYVDAVTGDDPAVTWDYQPAGLLRVEPVIGTCFLLFGLVQVYWDGWTFAAFSILYGVFMLVSAFGKDRWFDDDWESTNMNSSELAVHDAGLVKFRGRSKTLVPWDEITGVRSTDEELVIDLDGRFRNIRCDRTAIDDPEAVLEALESRCSN
ncbi:hypothetical protein [Halomontanus rarus]|uniref:hypothetical protein n=1 Tax=Halomontanus rarus TaxID=3034020 RepID=UPI001A98C8BF